MSKRLAAVICAGTMCAGMLSAGEENRRTLADVGVIATAMIDGDVCGRIETERSKKYARTKDPRDPWRAQDNYDVDDAAFIATKKTLIRLAHLCGETCDVNLWMPVEGKPGRVAIVIRNVHEISQFWNWGELDSEMPEEMAQVLRGGGQVEAAKKAGMRSVLSPVLDSLGGIVGVAEVVADAQADPRENVK